MLPLLDPSLDPLFWDDLRAAAPSAWHGHVPFAHWLVATMRPKVIVELGTHAGVSYAAFCQAVQRCGIDARCTAVDTWEGDHQAGLYDEGVYAEWRGFHDPRFDGFSRLLRARFDDAVTQFEDGTIDLLHIDGLHTADAVRHDFETWRPKLSDRAVVLLHDTEVRVRDFGVWRVWDELRAVSPGFSFVHGFGLGVLLHGAHPCAELVELLQAPIDRVRARFAAFGARMELAHAEISGQIDADIAEVSAEPMVDRGLDCGAVYVAERFVGPAHFGAVRIPADALARGSAGHAVWVVQADGRQWRHFCPPAIPPGDSVGLGFQPFGNAARAYFHLFVTDPCIAADGLPQALADRLGHRRPPIALETPALNLPPLANRTMILLDAGA